MSTGSVQLWSIVFAEILAVLHFYSWYFSFVHVSVSLEILAHSALTLFACCRLELFLLGFPTRGIRVRIGLCSSKNLENVDRHEVVLFCHQNFAVPRDLTSETFWIPACSSYSFLTRFLEN